MVRDRVGNYEIAETPILNLVVVARVTPAAQSALRVRVPERRSIEVGRIYPAIRIIDAKKRRMDYQ